MTTRISINNRRKFPRFSPKNDMYVLHYNFGKVIDIGMGGILFNYVHKDYLEDEPPPRGILFGHNDHYMDEIPFEVLSDSLISKSSSSKPVIRQRRVIFGDLTENQIRLLERFIIENAKIPQLAYEGQSDYLDSTYFDTSDYKATF